MRFIDSTPKPKIVRGENGMRSAVFVDDDRDGFELKVLQNQDGDFWLTIAPNLDDWKREHEGEEMTPYFGATIRVRTPMTGGGSHERLWHILAEIFR